MANGPANEYLPVPTRIAVTAVDARAAPDRNEYQLFFRQLIAGVIFPGVFMNYLS
jgi:hypothetical protein